MPRDTNRGQEQLHRVGTKDPVTGVITPLPDLMRQADWKTRDKSANLVRIDDDGAEIPEPVAGDETTDATSTEQP